MIKAWLIYNAERFARNENYAKLYVGHFAKKNILCEILLIEKLKYSDGKWYYNGVDTTKPTFVIMRTFNHHLSRLFEKSGVRVFNNARVSEICNNKYLTYLLARECGLRVMETRLMPADQSSPLPFDFPFVLKSLDGHGGKEVFLIENNFEYEEVLPNFLNRQYILQKVASDIGKDVRVYVLGGQPVAAMLRTAKKGFRSNYSLGGNAQNVEISAELKQAVKKINEALPSDFIGVDFVFDHGQPVLNEIEDIVGSRMLYAEGVDIVAAYVEYICATLSSSLL